MMEPDDFPEGADPNADAEQPKTEDSQQKTRVFEVLGVEQLDALTPPEPLVEGLLYQATLAQLSGPAGGGKTFLAISIAAAVAAAVTSWQGFRVHSPGPVFVVAAEGSSGLRARLRAACQQNRIPFDKVCGRIFFHTSPVQLGTEKWMNSDLDALVEAIQQRGCKLLIVDTRALCTAGLNENDAAEQAIAINNCLRIIRDTGCCVLIIHHKGKSAKGPRGSTAWDGQVWTDLRIEDKPDTNGVFTVDVEKHKDAESGQKYRFQLCPIELEGEYATTGAGPIEPRYRHTLVVIRVYEGENRNGVARDENATQQKILSILGDEAPPEGLTQGYFEASHGIAKQTFNRNIKHLVKLGRVKNVGPSNRSQYVLA